MTIQDDAFVTSLLTIVSLSFIFVLIFCWFRKIFASFYTSRLSFPGLNNIFIRDVRRNAINFGLFDWVGETLLHDEVNLLVTHGLDSVMLLNFFKAFSYLFAFLSIVGFGIVVPVDSFGERNDESSSSSTYVSGLDIISMANIKSGSQKFWVHVIMVYIVTAAVLYTIFKEYKQYTHLKNLYKKRNKAENLTVMVTEVPITKGQSLSQTEQQVTDFFSKMFPGVIKKVIPVLYMPQVSLLMKRAREIEKEIELSQWKNQHNVTRCTIKVSERESFMSQLLRRSKRNKSTTTTAGTTTISANSSTNGSHNDYNKNSNSYNNNKKYKKAYFEDREEYFLRQYRQIINDIELIQSQLKLHPVTRVCFVVVESKKYAALISQANLHFSGRYYLTQPAPEPRDIAWENLHRTYLSHEMYKFITNILTGILIIISSIPVIFSSSLSNLDSLSDVDGFEWISDIIEYDSLLSYYLQGFIPVVIVIFYFYISIPLFYYLSSLRGHYRYSELDRSVRNKHFLCLSINLLIIFSGSGVFFSNLSYYTTDSPDYSFTSIVDHISIHLPSQSLFFCQYILTLGLLGFSLELLRPISLLLYLISEKRARTETEKKESEQRPVKLNYILIYSSSLFVCSVSIFYSSMSPIILICSFFYFCFGYVVLRYNLIFVCVDTYDSQGILWPAIFSRLILSLLFFQLIMFSLLSVNGFSPSVLLIPLIPITVNFYTRVRNRFETIAEYGAIDELKETTGPGVGNENGETDLTEEELIASLWPTTVIHQYTSNNSSNNNNTETNNNHQTKSEEGMNNNNNNNNYGSSFHKNFVTSSSMSGSSFPVLQEEPFLQPERVAYPPRFVDEVESDLSPPSTPYIIPQHSISTPSSVKSSPFLSSSPECVNSDPPYHEFVDQ